MFVVRLVKEVLQKTFIEYVHDKSTLTQMCEGDEKWMSSCRALFQPHDAHSEILHFGSRKRPADKDGEYPGVKRPGIKENEIF